MKLSEEQKKIVERIADPLYTVKFLEKYYNESPFSINDFNYTLAVKNCNCARAFMSAVNGMLKSE